MSIVVVTTHSIMKMIVITDILFLEAYIEHSLTVFFSFVHDPQSIGNKKIFL